mmetsp:Transcript_62125/g.156838  ORF Transcript_62125/g.156838 Transcript_62125/m.156838 type:complete len:216 (-) Transcript_62125:1328-1975(-)
MEARAAARRAGHKLAAVGGRPLVLAAPDLSGVQAGVACGIRTRPHALTRSSPRAVSRAVSTAGEATAGRLEAVSGLPELPRAAASASTSTSPSCSSNLSTRTCASRRNSLSSSRYRISISSADIEGEDCGAAATSPCEGLSSAASSASPASVRSRLRSATRSRTISAQAFSMVEVSRTNASLGLVQDEQHFLHAVFQASGHSSSMSREPPHNSWR